jgi:ABC-type multidrug transport system fused ATPase/permease subunit
MRCVRWFVLTPTPVGRTGSGKVTSFAFHSSSRCLSVLQSSLTLSLLRCIFTEGNVYYDDLLTSTINLDALRSQITIIPQTVRTGTPLFSSY